DEPLDLRRSSHVGGKIGIPREHPAPVWLVRDEPEGAVADWVHVPRGLAETGMRDTVEQVCRQDREVGENEGEVAGRPREAQLDGGVVQCGDGRKRLQLSETRIAGRRVARSLQRPYDVAGRRRRAVVA